MDKGGLRKTKRKQDNQDGQWFAEYTFQGTDYTPFNFVDIVAHPADQVAFALFSKKSQWQIQNLCEYRSARKPV